MDQDAFNMSVRKFLKKVGVTSQQAIEEAIARGAGQLILVGALGGAVFVAIALVALVAESRRRPR